MKNPDIFLVLKIYVTYSNCTIQIVPIAVTNKWNSLIVFKKRDM